MVLSSRSGTAAPDRATGDMVRHELIEVIMGSRKKIVYLYAGEGYGKTTLLSQINNAVKNAAWLTVAGESDVFAFVNALNQAIRRVFPAYDFAPYEYLRFEGKQIFITLLADALLSSLKRLDEDFILILDDVHTAIHNQKIRKLMTCIMKFIPDNVRLFLSSREAPWPELAPLYRKESILELTPKELSFTRDEAIRLLGFEDQGIYQITEGWPLALSSFRVLLENGVPRFDPCRTGKEALCSSLFDECVNRLSPELVEFLRTTSCLETLDASMLEAVLNKKNVRLILESLVTRNIFTFKTTNGQYRYHSLFRDYLSSDTAASEKALLLKKVILYYYQKKDYSKAAEYAVRSGDIEMLEQIIIAGYKRYIKQGNFSELGAWFQALGKAPPVCMPQLWVAKGVFLSSVGKFTAANTCLDRVIPLIKKNQPELYLEAMVHKGRVLRNTCSYESSNNLLDELLREHDNLDFEAYCTIVAEKLYNLCWNSQIKEAYTLAAQVVEHCAENGNAKAGAWFERYLTMIHFFAGRMKDAVLCYEKSLQIPEDEHQYSDLHSIGIYAAKAYQMLGERDKAVDIITTELRKLRNAGRYEDIWAGYLLAAEIHYQNAFIDQANGVGSTYETTIEYFTLADEYAPLYRTTEFQKHWAKMQRLVYCLIFIEGPKDGVINEIYTNFEQAGDYLKIMLLGRLFGYYAAVSDLPNAVKCARLSIEIGERSDLMLIPTLAYGMLARAALAMNDQAQAAGLIRRFLQLCAKNGIYEYFRLRQAYDPILEFAHAHGIEPDFTKKMMEFAG